MDQALLVESPNKSNKKALILAAVGLIATTAIFVLARGAVPIHQNVKHMQVPETIEPYVYEMFLKWEKKYRTYPSEEERATRLKIFQMNVKKIKAIMDSAPSYQVSLNKFSDLTLEEFTQHYLTAKPNLQGRTLNVETCDKLEDNPPSIDWREQGIINPVRQQGQGADSAAIAAAEAIEASRALKETVLEVLSDQQIQDCNTAAVSSLDSAFTYTEGKGIEKYDDYPEVGGKQTCKYDKSKVVFVPSAHFDVTPNSEDDLETTVWHYPVGVYLEADSDAFQFYSGGIIDGTACGTKVDHAALVVGYNNTGTPYWIVKNSWGPDWGESGYVRVAKHKSPGAGICGIAVAPAYPIKRC